MCNNNKYIMTCVENYFESIDKPLKAYILGVIVYNMKIIDKKIIVELSIEDDMCNIKSSNYLRNIDKIKREFAYLGDCIYNINNNTIMLTIESANIIRDIYNLLNISNVGEIPTVCDLDIGHLMQKLNDQKDSMICVAFLKAYIERFGNISNEQNESKLHITYYLESNMHHLDILNIPYARMKLFNLTIAVYNNVNLIDFMGLMYRQEDVPYMNLKLYKSFYKILNNDMSEHNIPRIKIFKTDVEAIVPTKHRESDVGFDLTIIKESKRFNDKTVLYDTGIKLDIPNGYYVEIVPRSSLSKSGYMLANSVGIIDQSYRGNIFVALTKVVENADDIVLPFKCCQMIVRKQIYARIIESSEEFEDTERNAGGFGSTGGA